MPCNCDYMEPTGWEKQLSEVVTLLDEVNGGEFNKRNWEGYHPRAYGRGSKAELNLAVKLLCSKLQDIPTHDIREYSLELQMWWRDHQKADKERLQQEAKEIRENELRKEALAKLTPYERKLLDLDC